MSSFRQTKPRPRNRFRTDPALRGNLQRLLPPELFAEVAPELDAFAERCAQDYPGLAARAEANPPRHTPYDAWGNRIDRIEAPDYDALVRIGQQEGLVATAYAPRFGPHARLIQAALIHLFEPVSATATCPLAMTDAAATLLRIHDPALHARYGARLIARDDALLSGQWMTETAGGSDVSASETRAEPADNGAWRLHGLKWFTSAPASDIACVLARTPDAPPGAAGLSLFLMELRGPGGAWNGLTIRRLKDKLGTRAMPTVEIELHGALAQPIGGIGRGVAKVAAMLNIARLWAAYAAPAATGYLLDLARDYATRRRIAGTSLAHIPAHISWLAGIAAEYEAMLALCLATATTLGHAAQSDSALPRLLAPLTKFHCARGGIATASELLESFGGAGYLEDTGIPAVFRNAHVHTIWEGTSSVMAQDVLRALKTPGLAEEWREDIGRRLRATANTPAASAAARIKTALDALAPLLDQAQADPRRTATALSRLSAATYLAESAAWRAARQDSSGLAALDLVLRTPLIPPPISPHTLAELAFPPEIPPMSAT
jgi:alkylation response protein AidB-like acyl-CoA dehydrogenase